MLWISFYKLLDTFCSFRTKTFYPSWWQQRLFWTTWSFLEIFLCFFQVVLSLALGHSLAEALRGPPVALRQLASEQPSRSALTLPCLSLPGPSAPVPTALGETRSLPGSPSCLQPHPSDNKVGRHGAHLDCSSLTASFGLVPENQVFKNCILSQLLLCFKQESKSYLYSTW